jgi:hypothetical protein
LIYLISTLWWSRKIVNFLMASDWFLESTFTKVVQKKRRKFTGKNVTKIGHENNCIRERYSLFNWLPKYCFIHNCLSTICNDKNNDLTQCEHHFCDAEKALSKQLHISLCIIYFTFTSFKLSNVPPLVASLSCLVLLFYGNMFLLLAANTTLILCICSLHMISLTYSSCYSPSLGPHWFVSPWKILNSINSFHDFSLSNHFDKR